VRERKGRSAGRIVVAEKNFGHGKRVVFTRKKRHNDGRCSAPRARIHRASAFVNTMVFDALAAIGLRAHLLVGIAQADDYPIESFAKIVGSDAGYYVVGILDVAGYGHVCAADFLFIAAASEV